jgi:hypothetical protein
MNSTAMGENSSSAERMRRHRARKRCGSVIVQDIEIQPAGVAALLHQGWLEPDAANDAAAVRTALVAMVNDSLAGPRGLKRALKAIGLGLF